MFSQQYVNPEGFEEISITAVEQSLVEMMEILGNKNSTAKEKIEATRAIDSLRDTIVMVNVKAGEAHDHNKHIEKVNSTLEKQLDKLTDEND